MYKIGDTVVYRRNVCKVVDLIKSDTMHEDCYVLRPCMMENGSMQMQVPVSNKAGHLRDLITKEELQALIERMQDMDTLENKSANMRSQYAAIMKGDSVEDLITIIKTGYFRNALREKNHKKTASIDEEYLNKAETYLYNELSFVLHMPPEECRTYFNMAVAKQAKSHKKKR